MRAPAAEGGGAAEIDGPEPAAAPRERRSAGDGPPEMERAIMLYLTRKVGEAVVINDEIEVTVIEVRGKTVRLGLTFPADATVLRREVYDRVQAENRAALGLDIAGQTGAPEDVPAFVTRGPAPDEAG